MAHEADPYPAVRPPSSDRMDVSPRVDRRRVHGAPYSLLVTAPPRALPARAKVSLRPAVALTGGVAHHIERPRNVAASVL